MVVDACREHLRGCCGESLDKLEGPNYKVCILKYIYNFIFTHIFEKSLDLCIWF